MNELEIFKCKIQSKGVTRVGFSLTRLVGEIFICNEDTKGLLQVQTQFLGKAITGMGGGYKRMYVIQEEASDESGKVVAVHKPQYELDMKSLPFNKAQSFIKVEEDASIVRTNRTTSVPANINSGGVSDRRESPEPRDQHASQPSFSGDEVKSYEEGEQKAQPPQGPMATVNEDIGAIRMISSSKEHIVQLTRDGTVFTHGSGNFGIAGQGGSVGSLRPQLLKQLNDKRIVQVSCGQYHSLALTHDGVLYAWGRGFEGQLGIAKHTTIVSTPRYVKSLHKYKIKAIACGDSHSLALSDQGELLGWGQNLQGQLAIQKESRIWEPRVIPIAAYGHNQVQESFKNSEHEERVEIVQCAAGSGHSLALNSEGHIFAFGLNCYGQLGLGDLKTRWSAEQVIMRQAEDNSEENGLNNEGPSFEKKLDQSQQQGILPRVVRIAASSFASFCIDENGKIYSWGRGYIGYPEHCLSQTLPRQITSNTRNRVFQDIVTSESTVGFFAPVRAFSISPKCGPVSGGTLLTVLGTGLKGTARMRARFSYGEISQEVGCRFDEESRAICCKTPYFEEFDLPNHPSLELPYPCKLSITMDGIHYTECEESFLIYSRHIHLNSATPKCGSVSGGTVLTLQVASVDETTAGYLFDLTVGFQAKTGPPTASNKPQINLDNSIQGSQNNSQTVLESGQQGDVVNPLDVTIGDEQQEDWICVPGVYEGKGKVTCKVPALNVQMEELPQYHIDIALNGQQFTGRPVLFRFYDVKITDVRPSVASQKGGAVLMIKGTGMYDSGQKKIRLSAGDVAREISTTWDRKEKMMTCVLPPLTWIFGEKEVSPQEIQALYRSYLQLELTLNGQEWQEVIDFRYFDPQITRLSYTTRYGITGLNEEELAALTQEEKLERWLSEEQLQDQPLEDEEEEEKRKEELEKKRAQEDEEMANQAKLPETFMYIWGNELIKPDCGIKVSFKVGEISAMVDAVYKHEKKLGVQIPDLGADVPVGQHPCNLQISFNEQEFTALQETILYDSYDHSQSLSDIRKAEEEKAKKVVPGKKK